MAAEPLNASYDEERVRQAIDASLSKFYAKLTAKLENIDLEDILKKKNPYLYRAKGVHNVGEIVSGILSAFVSSSEETIFGNVFFEPLALAVSGGQKAVTEGVDITVERENTIYSIAVKSGTSVFNADSRKKQEQNFLAAGKRVRQAQKVSVPVVGYGYGKKRVSPEREKFYLEMAGEDFWTWLTGDPAFYIKIIQYMGTKPDEYAARFKEAYNRAENRLVREFAIRFCDDEGAVDWDKLVKYNSGW